MKPEPWRGLWLVFMTAFIAWLLWSSGQQEGQVATLNYSAFNNLLDEGRIRSATVYERTIRGEFSTPIEGKSRFVTNRVDPDIFHDLSSRGVTVTGNAQAPFWITFMSWLFPVILLVAFWALILRGPFSQTGSTNLSSIGRSRARVFVERTTDVTFDDVAGVDEAKAELMEIVDFLQNPDAYGRLGAHVPKGILLIGPPGTGKTLLARAIAGQAGVPFYSITGSEFVELFVGVGAARVRDLFGQARQSAPCIIFIDELDAIGRARGINQLAPHEEREQTLNQLLAEIDGFDPSSGIVLLAATNRPEILDPALLRAGRFDRQVLVDRPDRNGREAILKVHLRGVRTGRSADIAKIAAMTTGFTGADLANLVNEAAIIATRQSAEAVEMEHFEKAIERIIAGLERKTRLISDREREIVAVHEMGHALTASALPGSDPIQKISIIPRGVNRLGYTLQRPLDDRYIMTREELEQRICVLFGGRAAEAITFGTLSTGASDDLIRATDMARSMVETYAMDRDLGQMSFQEKAVLLETGTLPRRCEISEATAAKIDKAITEILGKAYQSALSILEENRDLLAQGARLLLEKETLGPEELRQITQNIRSRPGLTEIPFSRGPYSNETSKATSSMQTTGNSA